MSEYGRQRSEPGLEGLAERLGLDGNLLDRLEAFRRLLLRSAAALFVVFVVCAAFSKELFDLLLGPLQASLPEGSSLIATRVPEIFVVHLKIAFFVAILLTVPLWLILIARWVSAILPERQRHAFPLIVALGVSLFVIGALFAHFVLFPYAARFLTHFGSEAVHVRLSVEEAFTFYSIFVLGIAAVFEMPTIVLVLSLLNLVTPRFLIRHVREAIVFNFVVAAVVTPTPDVVTQLLVALPMMVLYALSALLSWLVQRSRAREG